MGILIHINLIFFILSYKIFLQWKVKPTTHHHKVVYEGQGVGEGLSGARLGLDQGVTASQNGWDALLLHLCH